MHVLVKTTKLRLDPDDDGLDEQAARLRVVKQEAFNDLEIHYELPDDNLALGRSDRIGERGRDRDELDDGENLGMELEEDSDDNEDSVDDSDEVKALKVCAPFSFVVLLTGAD